MVKRKMITRKIYTITIIVNKKQWEKEILKDLKKLRKENK
jgi:hypothetical protein